MVNWSYKYHNTTAWSSGWIDIDSPNNEFEIPKSSTRERQTTSTGSSVWLIPSNKVVYGQSELSWDFLSASSAVLASSAGTYALTDIMDLGYRIQFRTHAIDNETDYDYIECYVSELVKIYKLGLFNTPDGRKETFYDVSTEIDIRNVSTTEIV